MTLGIVDRTDGRRVRNSTTQKALEAQRFKGLLRVKKASQCGEGQIRFVFSGHLLAQKMPYPADFSQQMVKSTSRALPNQIKKILLDFFDGLRRLRWIALTY